MAEELNTEPRVINKTKIGFQNNKMSWNMDNNTTLLHLILKGRI